MRTCFTLCWCPLTCYFFVCFSFRFPESAVVCTVLFILGIWASLTKSALIAHPEKAVVSHLFRRKNALWSVSFVFEFLQQLWNTWIAVSAIRDKVKNQLHHWETGVTWRTDRVNIVFLFIRGTWASLADQHLLPIPSCPWRADESQPHHRDSGVTCRPDKIRSTDLFPQRDMREPDRFL